MLQIPPLVNRSDSIDRLTSAPCSWQCQALSRPLPPEGDHPETHHSSCWRFIPFQDLFSGESGPARGDRPRYYAGNNVLTVWTAFLDTNNLYCLTVLCKHVLIGSSMRFGHFSSRPNWLHFEFTIDSLVPKHPYQLLLICFVSCIETFYLFCSQEDLIVFNSSHIQGRIFLSSRMSLECGNREGSLYRALPATVSQG